MTDCRFIQNVRFCPRFVHVRETFVHHHPLGGGHLDETDKTNN